MQQKHVPVITAGGKWLFIYTALLFLFSCRSSRIEGPAESYFPSNISTSVSELPVTVELDVKKLEQAVNKSMKGLLFQGDNLSGRDLSVKIWKASDLSFFVYNNEITYKVPLKVWSRFGWSAKGLGITLGDRYEAEGTIALVYKTTVSIDKDWNLVSNTKSSGYEWIVKPTVKTAGVTIPVTPVANIAISFFEKSINDQIDRVLSEEVNLRKYVDLAWNELQKPVLISDTNSIWLKVTPSELFLTPFSSKGNKLKISLAMSGTVESYVGAIPPEKENIPLPELKFVERNPGEFNINISADVTYNKITEIAKRELLGVNFHEEDKVYRIDNLSLYSSEGRAVIVVQLDGTYKGKIYFTGKLIHNEETNALEIIEPDFDIKTKNTLLKTAGWLLHGKILRSITPFLSYPLEKDLKYVLDEANRMLDGYTLTQGVDLSGNLDTISVTKVSMIPGAVRIEANLKGNINLKVGELGF
jgi:hypothetical protein